MLAEGVFNAEAQRSAEIRRGFYGIGVVAIVMIGLKKILMAALVALLIGCAASGESSDAASHTDAPHIPAFDNAARQIMGAAFQVRNYRPGVAIFDFDRDGDWDFYITQEAGYPNRLFRNDGDLAFTDVAESAGVAAVEQGSSGVVACDVNNDGFQDLYVGGRGVEGDGLDYRSAQTGDAPRSAHADALFINRGDGTFSDATATALGDSVNLRSASTIACADVDLDGWLDIYVANMVDEDYFFLGQSHHPGHYNVLLHNNGDGTFTDVSEPAGVRGGQIWMRDQQGAPITFTGESGAVFEGYDPSMRDRAGNQVGDPTGPTHAATFFDYNDDGLPDLWVATDGDFLEVYRNDSANGNIAFTPVAQDMGFARVGNWMGFAVGDYDADGDLDVFATNAGYHLLLRPPQPHPGPDCKYSHQFAWGSCLNMLLRNDGDGNFADVAPETQVKPSALMPPASLDPENLDTAWEVPTGLAALRLWLRRHVLRYGQRRLCRPVLAWFGACGGFRSGRQRLSSRRADAPKSERRRIRGRYGSRRGLWTF